MNARLASQARPHPGPSPPAALRGEGGVRLLRDVATHDCGRAINPIVLEGRLHGGIAHGIGTALSEELVYDADGKLRPGRLMDYGLPAAELPPLETVILSFLTLLAAPLAAEAQPPGKVYPIGALAIAGPTDTPPPPVQNWEGSLEGRRE